MIVIPAVWLLFALFIAVLACIVPIGMFFIVLYLVMFSIIMFIKWLYRLITGKLHVNN